MRKPDLGASPAKRDRVLDKASGVATISSDWVCAQRDAMAKTVLVVDDNPKVRETLCRLFTLEAPFEVCGEAKNGREAIEKAEELQPDLIVMDLSMPGLNGLDAARAIKRLMPNLP